MLERLGDLCGPKACTTRELADDELAGPRHLDDLAQLRELSRQPIPLGTRRLSALRFGDPRVHALLQAISHLGRLPQGFQNLDLRPLVAAALGREPDAYSRGAMTTICDAYGCTDLVQRVDGTHHYMVTLDGSQVAGDAILNGGAQSPDPYADR